MNIRTFPLDLPASTICAPTPMERNDREALGPSRSGFGTKACVIADGKGRALAFTVAPSQAHEVPLAPGLIDRLPAAPGWIVGDRGLSANALRELIRDSGAKLAIPPKRDEAPVACRSWIYQNRNMVERLWANSKKDGGGSLRATKIGSKTNRPLGE